MRLLLFLCLLAGGFSPGEARAASDFERAMASVERLYGDFKYPQALKQLNQARSVSRGVDDDATIYLYEGIILFELSKEEQARSRFLAALLLKPDAQIPLSVSPKVEAEFEAQRDLAVDKLTSGTQARTPSPPQPSPPQVLDTRRAPTESVQATQPPKAPVSDPIAVSDRPEKKPTQKLSPPPSLAAPSATVRRHVPSRGARPLPFILVGAGVVAAGVGTGFGLSSRGEVSLAQTASFQSEVVSHQQAAQRSALTANLLFGTAGVAAVGALVSWLLLPTHALPEPVESP